VMVLVVIGIALTIATVLDHFLLSGSKRKHRSVGEGSRWRKQKTTYANITFVVVVRTLAQIGVPVVGHQNLFHLPVVEIVQLSHRRLGAVDQVDDHRRRPCPGNERMLKWKASGEQ